MNKNYVGTYGVIKKNGGIDLICSVNYEGGGLFASILKCVDENNEYLKVIIFGNCKKEDEKIAIIKKEGYEILKKPKFDVGDKVRLIKYPNEIAIVKEIIWHEKIEEFSISQMLKEIKREVIVGIMKMKISLKK